jgi:hypothetical protein
MPAGDASLTTAQVNQKNALTAITVSTAISEMSPQNIPLKGRTDFVESSRILATETIRV